MKPFNASTPGIWSYWCVVVILIMSLLPPQCHCASVPLHGGEIMSVVQSYKRVFQLLSAGLFLPGSIGIPDPCEVGVADLACALILANRRKRKVFT